MIELPKGYDPGNDLGDIRLADTEDPAHDRIQLYILELQEKVQRLEAQDNEPERAGHPDMDSAGGDGGMDRAYGEKHG